MGLFNNINKNLLFPTYT